MRCALSRLCSPTRPLFRQQQASKGDSDSDFDSEEDLELNNDAAALSAPALRRLAHEELGAGHDLLALHLFAKYCAVRATLRSSVAEGSVPQGRVLIARALRCAARSLAVPPNDALKRLKAAVQSSANWRGAVHMVECGRSQRATYMFRRELIALGDRTKV